MKKANGWTFQWKMSFNPDPDPSKQDQEVIFSRKYKRPTHPSLVFISNNLSQSFSQKHLVVMLEFKLTFEYHHNNVLAKVSKVGGLNKGNANYYIQSFHSATSRHADFLYDQNFNNSFKEKLESIQYNYV